MSFWKTTNYKYSDLTNIPLKNLLMLVNSMSRLDIIEWLSWNDPNGIYQDDHSLKELGNTLSKEEGLEIILRQIEENRTLK